MPIRPERGTSPVAVPVVITRPAQQAQAFAARVEALGRRAEVFPLLVIEALADAAGLETLKAAMARLEDFALVVFVSPNAIDAALPYVARWPAAVPIGVVGEGSRMALRAHGVEEADVTIFAPAAHGKMDSEALLAALPLAQWQGQRALIVRGQHGRDLLTDALRQGGMMVECVTAYRRLAPPQTDAIHARLLAFIDDGAEWVITSSEALSNLLAMAGLAGGPDRVVKLQRQRLFVSHHRIADTAQRLGFSDVILTGSGDDRLLAALQSCP